MSCGDNMQLDCEWRHFGSEVKFVSRVMSLATSCASTNAESSSSGSDATIHLFLSELNLLLLYL